MLLFGLKGGYGEQNCFSCANNGISRRLPACRFDIMDNFDHEGACENWVAVFGSRSVGFIKPGFDPVGAGWRSLRRRAQVG